MIKDRKRKIEREIRDKPEKGSLRKRESRKPEKAGKRQKKRERQRGEA